MEKNHTQKVFVRIGNDGASTMMHFNKNNSNVTAAATELEIGVAIYVNL